MKPNKNNKQSVCCILGYVNAYCLFTFYHLLSYYSCTANWGNKEPFCYGSSTYCNINNKARLIFFYWKSYIGHLYRWNIKLKYFSSTFFEILICLLFKTLNWFNSITSILCTIVYIIIYLLQNLTIALTFIPYLLTLLITLSHNTMYKDDVNNVTQHQGRFPSRSPRIQRPKDCVWTPFGPWLSCSKPCGTGIQRRLRTIAIKADPDGKLCRVDGASEIRLCNRQQCGAGLNRGQ